MLLEIINLISAVLVTAVLGVEAMRMVLGFDD
jgi:hypothetical protein